MSPSPILTLILCFYILSAPFLSIKATCQTPGTCGFDEYLERRESNYRRLAKERIETDEVLYRKALLESSARNELKGLSQEYMLPVVVHIISPDGTPVGHAFNRSDSDIARGIDMLNDIFANANDFHSNDGLDVGITFCLAKRTPANMPTNGINRIHSSLVNDNFCGAPSTNLDNDARFKALGSWDCCSYLNIYLVTNLYSDFTGCGLLGYATFPAVKCSGIDGVVMQGADWATRQGMQVAAHEIGHYLGLYHTFQGGCHNNDCLTDGDKVCDTPPDNARHSPCSYNSCGTDANAPAPNPFTSDVPDDTRNYMDYTSCMEHFTQGQIERMRFTIEQVRSCLLNSEACLPVFDNDLALVKLVTASSCVNQVCPEVTIENKGTAFIQDIRVSFSIDNALYERTYTVSLASGEKKTVNLQCIPGLVGLYDYMMTVSVIGTDDQYPGNNTMGGTISVTPPLQPSEYSVVPSACGKNGRISIVPATPGDYEYILIRPSGINTIQSLHYFDRLAPGNYRAGLRDKTTGCTTFKEIEVTNDCPPCLSGIINKYAAVTEIGCQGASLVLESASDFSIGDQILVIQMKGAEVVTTESDAQGDITNIGSAGNYEVNFIEGIEDHTIILRFLLERAYDPQQSVQVVSIPIFQDTTVCNLSCSPWNGKTGGILAIDVKGTLTLVGDIDVSGKGFRGGAVSTNFYNGSCLFDEYASSSNRFGAKGEGVTHMFDNRSYARGKRANGGGGANPVNTGGGGGANFGKGGTGGFQWETCILTSVGIYFGHGGTSLSSFYPQNRLFLGGGGGGGQQNDSYGSSGANGGGIVLINAQDIRANNANILADGNDVVIRSSRRLYDGQGGAGAGGTILINSENKHLNLAVSAKGGKGGDVRELPERELHGPGGGGGGGILLTNNIDHSWITLDVNGGLNGVNIDKGNNPYGSSKGETGGSNHSTEIFFSKAEQKVIEITKEQLDKCDPSSWKVCLGGIGFPYQLNEGPIVTDSCITNAGPGINRITVHLGGDCLVDIPFYIDEFFPLKDSVIQMQSATCDSSGWIYLGVSGGVPPYKFSLNGGPEQESGSFDNLYPGQYEIRTTDASGCSIMRNFEIKGLLKSDIQIRLDSLSHALCDQHNGTLLFSFSPPDLYPTFTLQGPSDTLSSTGSFTNLGPGVYELTVTDSHGCEASPGPFEILHIEDGGILNIYHEACENMPLTLADGSIADQTGTYDVLVPVTDDCEITYRYEVIFHPLYNSSFQLSICEGDSLIIGAEIISLPGKYTFTLSSEMGCDSIVELDLSLNPTYLITLNESICRGDTFYLNGSQLTESGIFHDSLLTIDGCDSLVILHLTVVSDSTVQDISICEGQTYVFGDRTLSTPGIYVDTLANMLGCDSISTLRLHVITTIEYSQYLGLCPGDSIWLVDEIVKNAGVYIDTLQSAAGCDSILYSTVISLPSFELSETVTICRGESLTIRDSTIRTPGTYSFNYTSINGCDSIRHINVVYSDSQDCIHCNVFVPSAFSPNNDGFNDNFTPLSIYVSFEQLNIFDRWGNLVFEGSKDNLSWDGTHMGKLSLPGVYVYQIRGTCANGEDYIAIGDVTLIR